MMFLSDNAQTDIIEAFKSTSRYLDDLLNIDNPIFEGMVTQIYPTELRIPKQHFFFFYFHFSISNGFVSSTIYDRFLIWFLWPSDDDRFYAVHIRLKECLVI